MASARASIQVQRPDRSCLPCVAGVHLECRHHPDKDGSQWVNDEDGERRIVLYERGSKKEIPRPPCFCEKGGHVGDPGTCNAQIRDNFTAYRCSKPAKGLMPAERFNHSSDHEPPMVEVCGIHLAGWKRRVANNERWAAESEERKKLYRDVEAVTRASEDWAQKLSVEFGLPVTSLLTDVYESADKHIRVAMSPEQAYTKLNEIRSLLNDVYGDDHPWA